MRDKLPLYLLTAAKNSPILVELKNGETLNGLLLNCDSWMNLTLKDVIQSSANGEEFLKLPEIYIKGMHIKYMRMPDEIMDHAKEQNLINMEQRNRTQKRRGGGSNFNSNRRGHGPNRNGGYNNQHNRRHNNQQQHSTSNGGKL
ncbi:U6 snRNA-associated Sm-like protein LSm4 [Meyerozyma sp. JA9]|nr:U6 snRNA-associated Sm-like protein LSm4 [Meyerozyma sp. JA9]